MPIWLTHWRRSFRSLINQRRKLNPEKLLRSKWTAANPVNREKHFLVTEVLRDEQDVVTECVLQAVINAREYRLDWRALLDTATWLQGWR